MQDFFEFFFGLYHTMGGVVGVVGGGGSRMVGREEREDGLTNFAIFLDGLQRKAESRTR